MSNQELSKRMHVSMETAERIRDMVKRAVILWTQKDQDALKKAMNQRLDWSDVVALWRAVEDELFVADDLVNVGDLS